MQFLEKDLETIIAETDNELLNERGLPINGLKKRQVRIGNYGIADLVTYDRWNMTIYELKQNVISTDAFWQSVRYSKGIKRYMMKKYNKSIFTNIILIGKEIDFSHELCYIPDIFDGIRIYTYKYEIDGIRFQEKYNYALINEGFNI